MEELINDFQYHTITKTGIIKNTKTKRIKSQWVGKNGYSYVDIIEDGKATKVAVHRLLAKQFIPNPENKRTVNHIDGNKLNNSLDNLEWATDKENMQHAYDNNLQPYRRNMSISEYQDLLEEFLNGSSITSLSKKYNNSLTQLSLHLREAAVKLDILPEYEIELKRQKDNRAKQAGLSKRKKITLQMIDKTSLEVIKVFNSIAEARDHLGKKSSGPISNVLAGRQNSAYGYYWKST
jgi:hypothetical protein